MSQIASEIRALVASRKGLQDSVGVCDDFQVGKKSLSLKAHLDTFTQEDTPLLGNPHHPKLLFDECEQLIVPLQFSDHCAVAVIKLSVEQDKRKAFIRYFDANGTDLADDQLVSLSTFFTENDYEVLYHCVSESIVKKGITPSKITCFKAIDLANLNADISENLSDTLIESNESESKESESIEIKEQANEKQQPEKEQATEKSPASQFWFIMVLVLGLSIYLGFDYIKPYTVTLMVLVPANPILAYIAFGGVFCAGWLILACLQHLGRERQTPELTNISPRQVVAQNIDETFVMQNSLLKTFENEISKGSTNQGTLNKEATASVRSLRLN